jgi:Fic family protein
MSYNWQHADWPDFHYETADIQDLLTQFAEKTGRVDGLLTALPGSLQTDAVVGLLVSEAIKTSEIEGELLSRPDVLSSIRNNLGLQTESNPSGDQRAEGVAELMIDARNGYADPLSQKVLFDWHAMLMKGTQRGKVGGWRTHAEPMGIVSGAIGHEIVHYEAPPSKNVPGEMKRFIQWFNQSAPGGQVEVKPPPVRSAIAHLYFESIHPFEDGNGRIGRAVAQKALSQGLGRPVLLSLSKAINADRATYYAELKKAQRTMDVTEWVSWFVRMLLQAQKQAEAEIEFTLRKVKLFDRSRDRLNDRQLKVLNRMLKEGPDGFQGGMSAKKYMAIAKTSKPTATRDLQDMVQKQILIPEGGGRSTCYQVNL